VTGDPDLLPLGDPVTVEPTNGSMTSSGTCCKRSSAITDVERNLGERCKPIRGRSTTPTWSVSGSNAVVFEAAKG
jgi:hypothetical protein